MVRGSSSPTRFDKNIASKAYLKISVFHNQT